MGSLSPMHWLLLILVVVLLFGSRKLPDAARAVGRSLRILKAETASLREDDDRREEAAHRDDRRDRDYRDREGYDERAPVDERAPRDDPDEPRAVEGPRMNPTVSGTRADSRAPDTQPR